MFFAFTILTFMCQISVNPQIPLPPPWLHREKAQDSILESTMTYWSSLLLGIDSLQFYAEF
jgi:hypothetical protein